MVKDVCPYLMHASAAWDPHMVKDVCPYLLYASAAWDPHMVKDVCPYLEYASAAWHPHMVNDVTKLEPVQWKFSCVVTDNKEREEGCMTRLLLESEWSPLAHRRHIHRLTVPYMSNEVENAIEMPTYVQSQISHTLSHHEI